MSQDSGTVASWASSSDPFFSQRIVYVDSYTSFPIPELDVVYSQFKGTEVKRVPVIRIYGATDRGQKTCTHVHGVFPYLYIREETGISNLSQRLALALDRGISAALNTDGAEHVYKIVPVTARSFYGFKGEEESFLKILFYSPIALTKAIHLLQSGNVLGQVFQPYEAHIPYILQFLMDFQLYGMNFVHFSAVKFRGAGGRRAADEKEILGKPTTWDLSRIPLHLALPSTLLKKTRCELEIDVLASQIVLSKSSSGKNPGIEAIWMDERERRRLHGITDWAQIPIPESQNRNQDSFVFLRELELREMLEKQLKSVTGMDEDHIGPSSPFSESEQKERGAQTPASQILVHDLSFKNRESPPSSPASQFESGELDEEMVALLEDMARERQNGDEAEEEEDSILGSQVAADSEGDPVFLQRSTTTAPLEEEEEEDLCWTQGFLSNTMLVEALERTERSLRQDGPSDTELGGGFMLDQTDGQGDETSSESEEETQLPSSQPVSERDSESDVQFLCQVESPAKDLPKPRVPDPNSPQIVDVSSDSDSEDTHISPRTAAEENSSFEFEEAKESGIQSFYVYPGDESFLPTETEAESPQPEPDSQQSITSFYEFSSAEESEGSEREASFLNISDDFSQVAEGSESYSEETPEQMTRFQRKKAKDQRRQKERCAERRVQNLIPSLFRHEVQPLKNPPQNGQLKSGGEAPPTQLPHPPSLNYFRNKVESRKWSLERRRAMQEMLSMKAELENQPSPRIPLTKPPSPSKGRPSAETESDEDEVPGPVRRFGFGGNTSDGEGQDSDSEGAESDRDTVLASPLSLPPAEESPSQGSTSSPGTPRSALRTRKSRRKRRRLTWEDESDSSQHSASARRLFPRCGLDESELDSVSFTTQQAASASLDSSNFQNAKAFHECQFLSTLSMEVLCSARNNLTPNPEQDPIQVIFYSLHEDKPDRANETSFGCFVLGSELLFLDSATWPSDRMECVSDEVGLIRRFISFVYETDPDILVGYEIAKFSWGYLIERGLRLGIDMTSDLSRLLPLPQYPGRRERERETSWNEAISGRIVLNLWRLLRHEITVTSYTFENAVFQILHEKVHRLSHRILDDFWSRRETREKVVSYYRRRVDYVLRIIQKLDLVNRTSELARLFGIQFFEVLSRGSQFRVESMMLRLAKPANLVAPSPSPQQRSRMKAPEYLPLIMEPESKFYSDPVAVLDFQSLYPSMMMAYNYCYSTCLGRVHHLAEEGSFELGCLSQSVSLSQVTALLGADQLHISPAGVVFVKETVRKGILGEMLAQILETRQMVKRSMKKWKEEETLQKVLDSRQLGLKLIANVTYGYTSANFSGRMACVEIADSVVSKGRETLQRAIDYVKQNEDRFGGRVVYGDTDSLFVHFPGKTKEEAFRLAQRIVDDVTSMNPKPVKLKLEKVYLPCILQTKKRYVGFSYETPDQAEAKYEAKGIETVRRDGCPATAKILEGTLKTLFVTQNEGMVRKFVQEQFRKIFKGRVSLSQYTFAREYRGRAGYKPTAVVPALEIAKKLSEKDPRAEPLPSERVPYIVVYGSPGLPLIQLVRRPEEFIGNPNLRLNAHYYIEKAILPALNRCLALAKMEVGKWYAEMPRQYLRSHYMEGGSKKGTIDQYFKSESCIKCECRTVTGFCEACFPTTALLNTFLDEQEFRITNKFESTFQVCRSCSGEDEMICINLDCPVKHRFMRYDRDYRTKLPDIQKLSRRIKTSTAF